MKPNILIGLVFASMVAVIGGAFLLQSSTVSATVATTQASSPTDAGKVASTQGTTRTATASGYTLSDVAKHSSASSCWAAINGNVYDLTHWINQHPGGSGAILSLCGTDGSAAFNAQHGGQGRPEQELANFYIGKLAS